MFGFLPPLNLALLGRGPGPELVSDGGFDVGITQVSAQRDADLTWENSNSLKVAVGAEATAEPQGHIQIATVVGARYRIRATKVGGTTAIPGILRAYRANQTTSIATTGSVSGDGVLATLTFTALDTTSYVSLGCNNGVAGNNSIWDDVSCRRSL